MISTDSLRRTPSVETNIELAESTLLQPPTSDEDRRFNSMVDSCILQYIREESGLGRLPERHRERLAALAWERGKPSYTRAYRELVAMVEVVELVSQ